MELRGSNPRLSTLVKDLLVTLYRGGSLISVVVSFITHSESRVRPQYRLRDSRLSKKNLKKHLTRIWIYCYIGI